MINKIITKPTEGQYPDWAPMYFDKVEGENVFAVLESGLELIIAYVEKRTDEQLLHSYSEGKWTIKEVLVHLMDVERVFNYRGFTCARQDSTSLPGFDHNGYVPRSGANERSKESLLAEYKAVRQSTIQFFSNLEDKAFDFIGEAKDQPCTARAMLYMIAGHEQHHLNILEERY